MARDTIRVRFDPNGFYHPAYGRLGRGKDAGTIYRLPAEFGERETITVPIMDHTSKPPRQVGEKKITRFKNIPSSAEILDDAAWADMEEEAADENKAPPALKTPKVATPEALERVTGAGRKAARQDAVERTTGTARRSRKVAAAE